MDRTSSLLIAIVIGSIVMILVVWWIISIFRDPHATAVIPPPAPTFNDLWEDFLSHDPNLWMTENLNQFDVELRDNTYRYRIMDSTLSIIYDNRSKSGETPTYELKDTVEVITAASGQTFGLIRDELRNLAIRVTDSKSKYRVVHISGV